jgi:hypothetical protein
MNVVQKRPFSIPPLRAPAPSSDFVVDEALLATIQRVNPALQKSGLAYAPGPTDRSEAIVCYDPELELTAAINAFVRGRMADLSGEVAQISAERKRLAEREVALQQGEARALQSFLAMLERDSVRTHGKHALLLQPQYLELAAIDPAQAVGAAASARRKNLTP